MRDGKRSRLRPFRSNGSPAELRGLLGDSRPAGGPSLREVEEVTGKAVSDACSGRLEREKIKGPSPGVLQWLAEVWPSRDQALMEETRTPLPSPGAGGRRARLPTFAIDDLTAEEEDLPKCPAFLRSRKPS